MVNGELVCKGHSSYWLSDIRFTCFSGFSLWNDFTVFVDVQFHNFMVKLAAEGI